VKSRGDGRQEFLQRGEMALSRFQGAVEAAADFCFHSYLLNHRIWIWIWMLDHELWIVKGAVDDDDDDDDDDDR
jgi:hypothetical protein